MTPRIASIRPAASASAALLAAIVALAAVARLALVGRESYWIDEIHSVLQARMTFGTMIADLVARDVHPPLYQALLWVWVRVMGEGEAATRLLSVIAGTAALLPLYGIGRILYDRSTSLVACLLLALNGFAVFYARETRPYALLLLTTLAATYLLVWWIASPDRRRLAAYVGGAALLAYTHIFGLFVLIAHGLFVLGWLPALRRRFLLAAAGVALLFLPWLPAMLGQVAWVQEGFWIPPIGPEDPFVWGARWAGFDAALGWILGLLILIGLARETRGAPGGRAAAAPALPLLVLWIVVPLGLPVAASFIGQPIFSPKCAIVSFGAFALLAARGLLWLPARAAPWAVAALAAAMAVQMPGEIHLTRTKQQWREMADLARAEAARGTLIVADEPIQAYLRYYLPDTPVVWLADAPRLDRLEARAAGGRVMHVQIQPAVSRHEPALRQRWPVLQEHRLVRARAVVYALPECPRASPCSPARRGS